MKKITQIVAVVLLIVTMGMTFCGCDLLDDAKAYHAILNEDGTITWNGHKYIAFEVDADLYITSITEEMVFVTEPDVPVLLKSGFGESYSTDKDHILLTSDSLIDEVYPTPNKVYYCREDKYDQVVASVSSSTPEVYYYDYYVYANEDDYKGVCKQYKLTAQEMQTLNQIISTVSPKKINETTGLVYDTSVYLYTADRHLLLSKPLLSLCKKGQQFYIMDVFDAPHGNGVYYDVPQQYNKTCEAIMQAHIENEYPPFS